MRVARSRTIAAPPEALWAVVSSVGRLPEWLALAEGSETLEGEGAGRLQRVRGHWGRRRSELDQRVITWEPPHRLAWVHEAERLDGRPAPRFARETRFEIRLEPVGAGTRVTLESVQVPASMLKGALIGAFGARALGRAHERSLRQLDAVVSAPRA